MLFAVIKGRYFDHNVRIHPLPSSLDTIEIGRLPDGSRARIRVLERASWGNVHSRIRTLIGYRQGRDGNRGAVNPHIEKPRSPLSHLPFCLSLGFLPIPNSPVFPPSRFEPEQPLDGLRIQRERYGPFQSPGVLNVGNHVRFGACLILLR